MLTTNPTKPLCFIGFNIRQSNETAECVKQGFKLTFRERHRDNSTQDDGSSGTFYPINKESRVYM